MLKLEINITASTDYELLKELVRIVSVSTGVHRDTTAIEKELKAEIMRRMSGNREFYIDTVMLNDLLSRAKIKIPSRAMLSKYKRGNSKKLINEEIKRYPPLLAEGVDYIKQKIGGDFLSESGLNKIIEKLNPKNIQKEAYYTKNLKVHLRSKELYAGYKAIEADKKKVYSYCGIVDDPKYPMKFTENPNEPNICKMCLKKFKLVKSENLTL